MEAFINWLNNISKPNPKYIQDKLCYEVSQIRNKTILILEVFLFLFYLLLLILDPSQALGCLYAMFFCFSIIALLLLSCKTHPEVFNIGYNLTIAGCSVLQIFTDVTTHYSWKGVDTYPIIVLVFTGSFYHCLLQAGFQMILLKTVYEPALVRTLGFTSPEVFAKDFVKISMISSPLLIIFVAFLRLSLQSAYKRISESEKKKEEAERQKVFLLGFSHELRNLINSIMGNINLANLECVCNQGKNLLTNAEFCGKLLLHLVNNILDTGKAEVGDLEINLAPTKIYDTIENIWNICSELIKRKNLKGTMVIQKNIPPLLNLDHCRLTQIFLNLIGNAVKFTDSGSIDVSIEWLPDVSTVNDKCFEPKPLNDENELDEGIFEKTRQFSLFDKNSLQLNPTQSQISKDFLAHPSDPSQGVLKVIVSDTGSGINPEGLKNLFQKFIQVSSDPSKRTLGTGLGLFITKELCNRMGGDIKVFTRPTKGTHFIFCIPVEALPSSSQEPQSLCGRRSTAIIPTERIRAMIVDDLEFCRDVMKDYFQKLGVEVSETAQNGLEAYMKFVESSRSKKLLNIISMDLSMPVMNGKEAVKRIREFERENDLEPSFIIIASGNCSHTEIEECLDKKGDIKANVFLKKPLMMSDVARILSEYF